jgi:hypothetical protein
MAFIGATRMLVKKRVWLQQNKRYLYIAFDYETEKESLLSEKPTIRLG